MMKWTLQLRARYDRTVSIQQRHDGLMRELASIERPFGLTGAQLPAAPEAGSRVSAVCSLTRSFGRPVVSATTSYARRAVPPPTPGYAPDDLFNLDYDAKRVTKEQYVALIERHLPGYIGAFNAYRAELGSEQPFLDKLGETLGRPMPLRFIHVVNFWDSQLINAAFGRSVDEVAGVLTPHCSIVRRLGEGLYTVMSLEPMAPEDQWALHCKLWALLNEGAHLPHSAAPT